MGELSVNLFGRNPRPGWDLNILRDHHDPISYIPFFVINICVAREWKNGHVIADAGVLIQYGAFNMTVRADTNGQAFIVSFIIVRAHHNTILDHTTCCDLTADPNNGMGDLRFENTGAFRDQYITQIAILHDRTGQEACIGIDGKLGIVKIKRRFRRSQRKIGFVERTDRPNILPIAVEIKTIDRMRFDRFWNDISAKIVMIWEVR